MANRKISDFTALTQPAPADVLPIVDVSEALDADKNKKITVEEIFKSIPSGSAASPGIAFEGDDGNGIYFVSPDTIGISTNGTSRITVGSGGTVAVAGGLTAGGNAVVTVGDTGTVTSAMIASGTIVDADINASAEIAVSKLADGTARQLLQTDAAGTGVEWTSNVDIPGTLDVTGATVLDSTLSVPLGSAASPTIFFTGDSNTGIYSPGADQVAISTNGTGRLFIGSTGTVNFTGAGTAGSTQAVSFNGSAPVNSLVIDSSGRVGLGTSSPGARLHVTGGDSVFGASNLTRILNANQIIDFTNAAQDTYVAGRINGLNLKFYTNTGSGIDIDSSGCVGIGTSTPGAEIPEDNSGNQLTGAILDVNGHLLFSSAAPYIKPNTKAESGRPLYIQAGDTRQTNYNGGSLYLEAGGQDPSWGGTANGGNVFIDGGQKGGVGTDGNVILASNRGRVGISTSSPGALLDVRTGSDTNSANFGNQSLSVIQTDATINLLGAQADGNGPQIVFNHLNVGQAGTGYGARIVGYRVDSANNRRMGLDFRYADANGATQQGFRLNEFGRVGIGTTGPTSRLTVADGVSTTFTGLPVNTQLINTGALAAGLGAGIDFSATYTAGTTTTYAIIAGCKENATSGDPAGYLAFGTRDSGGGTSIERARIDSSGRLLVGTSSSRQVNASIAALQLQIEGTNYQSSSMSLFTNQNAANGSYIVLGKSRGTSLNSTTIVNSGDSLGALWFCGADGNTIPRGAIIEAQVDGTPGANDMPGRLVFSVTADGASSPTERMRIISGGTLYTFVTGNAGNYFASSQTPGTTATLIRGAYSATANALDGTECFRVYSNGNVVNTNNSYGAISDIKLKENIVDANSQWDDLKAIQVRNYNFKEGQIHTQLGVVAQEVELVSPGLVSESPDRDEEGNDLGTVTKSVNYSVLYMKAVKALQEAMERIETLEASNADLLARVSVLEQG